MTSDMTPEEKITKARTNLLLDHRFFGSLAMGLTFKEDPSAKTVWTDGVTFGYNPKYVTDTKTEFLKFDLAQAVMHLGLSHHVRRQKRDDGTWNQACDYVVNPILQDADIPIPPNALIDQRFHGKSVEEVFSTLWEEKQQEDGQDGSGEGEGQDQGQNQGNSPGQGSGQNDGQGESPAGGEVRDFPGGTDKSTATQEEQKWEIAMAQAATQAKAIGTVPGNIERVIEDLKEAKVDWIEKLIRFVTELSRNDYSWKRPNVRYAGQGVILPSLYDQQLPPIVVAIDSSGSMSQKDLETAATEIDYLLSLFPTTVQVLYCDTNVRHTEEFTQDNRPVKLHAKGGGGTRFSPVFEYVDQMDETPICVIYFTDLECSDFGKAPDCPVLWIQTTGYKREVPFGEVTRIHI